MTPVIILSDAYLAHGAEPWLVPDVDQLAKIENAALPSTEKFSPMLRNDVTLARPWASPGTPGYEHRIGGLEKDYVTGQISVDPLNHERMVQTRAEKIARIADDMPECRIEVGASQGKLLVIGWGSTYGSIREAVEQLHGKGSSVGHLHLRGLCPFPRGLETVMSAFSRVLVAELNSGQLAQLLRAKFCRDIKSFTKIQGKPIRTDELMDRILKELEDYS
jgi:2-oxoglutarate ferredoxin oxidoreductase subunit alpha